MRRRPGPEQERRDPDRLPEARGRRGPRAHLWPHAASATTSGRRGTGAAFAFSLARFQHGRRVWHQPAWDGVGANQAAADGCRVWHGVRFHSATATRGLRTVHPVPCRRVSSSSNTSRKSFAGGASSITGNRGLVRSLTFPRLLLPLSVIIQRVLEMVPMVSHALRHRSRVRRARHGAWLTRVPDSCADDDLQLGSCADLRAAHGSLPRRDTDRCRS